MTYIVAHIPPRCGSSVVRISVEMPAIDAPEPAQAEARSLIALAYELGATGFHREDV